MGDVVQFIPKDKVEKPDDAIKEAMEVNSAMKHSVKHAFPIEFSKEEMIGTCPTTLGFLRTDFFKNLHASEPFFESLYVRKTRRVFTVDSESSSTIVLQKPNCFDIASVEVQDQFKGKGIFTAYLDYLMDTLPKEDRNIQFIYIENVLNDRFAVYLENKLGMIKIPLQDELLPPSFYIEVPQKQVSSISS